MERASPRQGERLLDVGCGCGATTLAFADAVGPSGRVVGVDVSRPMLDRAEERGTGRSADPGPFAFADAARVERILVAAGFSDVAIDRWDAEVQVAGEGGTDEAVHFAATVGPGSRLLQDLDDTTRARALTAVRALLAPLVKPSGLWMAGSVWIVRAGVPG